MSTLHITNGDCAGDILRTIVSGPVVTAADVLHEGPCPPVDGERWYETRARFLAGGEPDATARIKAGLAEGDRQIVEGARRARAIAEGAGADDIVLWFEHDLFDQLAIIRVLDLIARTVGGTPRVSLICAGSFPGIERFIGLGQLSAEQLATLDGTGAPLTAGHFALAMDAWRAFRAPDPSDLLRLAQQMIASQVGGSEGGAAFTFLGEALLRFLAEYPSAENGLSRTEESALEALLSGPRTAGALFGASQETETRPFLGDLTFFDTLRRLSSGRVPLVMIDGGGDDLRARRITITAAGRDVVARRADHVALNGIDLWRGGVHLTGSDRSPWRWDAGTETLVS